MIKHIAQAFNSLLAPFDIRIIRVKKTIYETFDMVSAIKRVAGHKIPIRSIIDIGASNGKWSMDAMSIFPSASFLAVDPLLERKKNLEKLKQKYNNFDYVLCAAGEKDGDQVTLEVTDDLDGSTVDGSGGIPRSVLVKTVDAIVKEKNLEGPFMLKFDTHGYEIPILLGARDTLANTNVVVMEVYNFKITDHALRFHEMCSHMEQIGFRCYDIASPMLRPHDNVFWQMDILFARSDSAIFS